MNIPFVDLKAQYNSIQPQIDNAIASVINETAFIGGKYVNKFEEEFANLYGVKHCISCANGTDSLYITMKMLGIGAGDEVITAANSWISSSETITQTGAKPVFVDVESDFYTIDTDLLKKAINPNTKAIIIVHLYGQVCNMENIIAICNENKIVLIEDCAQAHFSEYNGVRTGLTGLVGSFSFYPGKNLGAYGDAGCIITNDDDFALKCKMYARHGALKKHQHTMEGINSRLDGLQAAILSAKLPFILEWTKLRNEKAANYNKLLAPISEIELPKVRNNTMHSYHLYVIKSKKRDELAKYLKENGIETAIHYPTALPLLPAYAYLGAKASDYPVSYQNSLEILSLPIFPEITIEQQEYVANTIVSFYTINC
jgi:dTDP-4-amino-4,6-dideoxygalactose transaminase